MKVFTYYIPDSGLDPRHNLTEDERHVRAVANEAESSLLVNRDLDWPHSYVVTHRATGKTMGGSTFRKQRTALRVAAEMERVAQRFGINLTRKDLGEQVAALDMDTRHRFTGCIRGAIYQSEAP